MATAILIIATSRSALFKIKRATRARSETRLPCCSSPFVSVLPVVGPQIPMNRSLPPRTTILFSRGLPEKRGVHKKRPTRLSVLRALPARSRAVCTKQWLGQSPTGAKDAPMDGSRPVIGDDLDWEYSTPFRYLRQNFSNSVIAQDISKQLFEARIATQRFSCLTTPLFSLTTSFSNAAIWSSVTPSNAENFEMVTLHNNCNT